MHLISIIFTKKIIDLIIHKIFKSCRADKKQARLEPWYIVLYRLLYDTVYNTSVNITVYNIGVFINVSPGTHNDYGIILAYLKMKSFEIKFRNFFINQK